MNYAKNWLVSKSAHEKKGYKMAKFDVDSDLIRKLANLLEETNLSEIEYSQGQQRIRVSKENQQSFALPQISAAPVAPAATPAAVNDTTSSEPAEEQISYDKAEKAPMVGTVYLSPEPGADAFAQEGDMVTEGQVILIIEAMKIMNQIRASKSGKLTHILVKNEEPIEFEQPLFIIE